MELIEGVEVQIVLLKDIEVFFIDELVEGYVTLNAFTNLNVNFIGIDILGAAKVSWNDQTRMGDVWRYTTYKAKEEYHRNCKHFCFGERVLSADLYRYDFKFHLNRNCLTSFESKYGFIRYELNFKINRAPLIERVFKRAITVINYCDINMNPKYKMPLQATGNTTTCCWMVTSRKIFLTLRTPFGTYAPGQKMTYALELNNQSKKQIYGYRIKFYRKITFTSKTPFYTQRELIKKIGSWSKLAGETPNHILEDDIIIPVTPPTTSLSEIISVKYILEVRALVSCSIFSTLKMQMEIHIGTVPLRESLPAKQGFEEPKFLPEAEERFPLPLWKKRMSNPIVEVAEVQQASADVAEEEQAPPAVAEEQQTPPDVTEEQQAPLEVEEIAAEPIEENLPPNPIKKMFQIKQPSADPEEELGAPKRESLPLTPIIEVIEHQPDSLETSLSDVAEEQQAALDIEEIAAETIEENLPPNPIKKMFQIKQRSSDREEDIGAPKRQSLPLTPIIQVVEYHQDSVKNLRSDGMGEVIEVQEISPQAEENVPKTEEIITKAGEILQQVEDVSPQAEEHLSQAEKQYPVIRKKRLKRYPYVEVVEELPTVGVDLPPDSRMRPYGYRRASVCDPPFRDLDELENDTLCGFLPFYPVYKLE